MDDTNFMAFFLSYLKGFIYNQCLSVFTLSYYHHLFVSLVSDMQSSMLQVIAGKGHETYQTEGDKKEFFDDREECREALQYVDELHQAGIDTSEFPWRLVNLLFLKLPNDASALIVGYIIKHQLFYLEGT